MGEFETACQRSDLQLFVLPPRSPKLNGHVERAQRTHTEESRLPAGRSGSATMETWTCPLYGPFSAPGNASTTPSAPIRPWRNAPLQSTPYPVPPRDGPQGPLCLICSERLSSVRDVSEFWAHRV